jgi:site-specific recombinase XerD
MNLKRGDAVGLELLEEFHHAREIAPVTWKVEPQTLRTFFAYCVSHKWVATNPATELKPLRNIKPNEVVPYTLLEESEILACDRIGGGRYQREGVTFERLRARAMMMLRHTALRVSDVCTLRKDAISWDRSNSTWLSGIVGRSNQRRRAGHLRNHAEEDVEPGDHES